MRTNGQRSQGTNKRNLSGIALALALAFIVCIGAAACALAEDAPTITSFFQVELPEANLRLTLPDGWTGFPMERDDNAKQYFFREEESEGALPIFLLTVLPKEGIWSDDVSAFGYMGESLFAAGENEQVQVLEWLTLNRMRAVLAEVVGQPFHLIYLEDEARYIFGMYSANGYRQDARYAAGVQSIYNSLSLIDNPHPRAFAPAADFETAPTATPSLSRSMSGKRSMWTCRKPSTGSLCWPLESRRSMKQACSMSRCPTRLRKSARERFRAATGCGR
ncbi:hypothetical protein FACS1894196_2440 [Clostridia bacterium]|nr:hypothetical protein FACS1894196_2440 [Clostridia bacterium]